MTQAVFPKPGATTLLIIDVQERLARAMPGETFDQLVKANVALIEMAKLFDIAVVVTEQYPKGLGATVDAIAGALGSHDRVEKTEFSACRNADFADRVNLRRDVILTGMESHVCVLQTALDLVEAGHNVFVPHDAVCSRTERNRDNGLDLMARGGVVVTNSETLIFGRLEKAGGDAFKRLSTLVR